MAGRDEFFVGFFPTPPRLRVFLCVVAAVLVGGVGLLAWAVGATQDDPGDGRFRFDLGRQAVTGVVEVAPYPLLRIVEGNERLPAGHTLMLSGVGKRGAQDRAGALAGKMATAAGVLLTRGDLDMLQLAGGAEGLGPASGGPDLAAVSLPAPEPLGRWRLAGEMCDGKCYAGAMRPGRGLAHRACAELCVDGGIPPVFVSTRPVEGAAFMLLAGPDGGPLTPQMLDDMAVFVTLEGEIERRGDLLILKIDPATVEPI